MISSSDGYTSGVPDDCLKLSVPAAAPSVGQLRREATEYARQMGAVPAACDAVALAVSEAVANVVVHAYADARQGEVILEAKPDDSEHLLVLVCDAGRGMRPRTDSPGLGLGLSLMAQMADDFKVTDRPTDPGTMVAMRFSLDGSGSAL